MQKEMYLLQQVMIQLLNYGILGSYYFLCFIVSSRNGQCIQTLSDGQDSISSVCMDDTCIITGYVLMIHFEYIRSVDGSIRTYDIRAGQLHQDNIKSIISTIFS